MKNYKAFGKAMSFILAICLAFGVCAAFVGCNSRLKVTVRLANPSIAVGGTTTALVAIGGTEDQEYTLSSGDEAIATVGEDGVITGVASGTVDIIATAHADGKSTGKATLIVGGGGGSGSVIETVGITASLEKGQPDRLSAVGQTTRIVAKVTGAEDATYKFSVDSEYEHYINVDTAGTVTVINLPESRDVFAKVTATSNADTRRTATVSIRIEAPYQAGKVGDLTSQMILAITDPSITISGTITDVYDDLSINANDYTEVYNTKVEMESGKWKCEWNIANPDSSSGENNVMTTMYAKNDDSISIRETPGLITNTGSSISNVYINKNNEVERETLVDYAGVPVLWENQCMYNLFKDLPVNNFETVENNELMYHLKSAATTDLSMVRIAASLSSLFTNSDIFSAFYFVLNSDKTAIEKIVANTAVGYDTGDATTATARWWTETELTLSKVGETVVANPTPYGEPQHVSELSSALAGMKALDSYFFVSVDTSTKSPVIDPDDYEYEMSSMSAPALASASARSVSDPNGRDVIWGDRTTNTGNTGAKGWVTSSAVIVETISKYTSTMDGMDTRYEYSGYRDYPDGPDGAYYERIDWTYATPATQTTPEKPSRFRGVQKITGSMSDALPAFDFSPNVFKYEGKRTDGCHVFRLQADAVMADVAQQVSMYGNAKDAYASTQLSFTIAVKDGKVIETVYPYNLSDNYLGYVTTTYSRFDETELPLISRGTDSAPRYDEPFDIYDERVLPTAWNQLSVKHYHMNHSTLGAYDVADAETAMKRSFGENGFSVIPAPNVFLFDVFGDIFDAEIWDDGVSGPFFNWNDKADGGYYDIYSFKCKLENGIGKLSTGRNYPSDEQWNTIKTELEKELNEAGFELNPAQTGKTSAFEGVGNRYITFQYANKTDPEKAIVIQIGNNYSHFLDIDIFQVGAINRTITN